MRTPRRFLKSENCAEILRMWKNAKPGDKITSGVKLLLVGSQWTVSRLTNRGEPGEILPPMDSDIYEIRFGGQLISRWKGAIPVDCKGECPGGLPKRQFQAAVFSRNVAPTSRAASLLLIEKGRIKRKGLA